jgi:hypothetical protein
MFKKTIGLIILITGLVFTLYTGLDFITKEKVVEIGSFQLTKDKEHPTNWSPLIGIGVMIIGGTVIFSGNKNRFKMNAR